MTASRFLSTTVGILCMTGVVGSAVADGISWTFQKIAPPAAGTQVSLAMRTDATWPTVFYRTSTSLFGSSLTPVGWQPSIIDPSVSADPYLRTAASANGQIAFAYESNNAIHFGQSSPQGWQQSTLPAIVASGFDCAPDVSYLSNDRPIVSYSKDDKLKVAVHNGSAWETDTVYYDTFTVSENGGRQSMDIDSQDRIGIAYQSTTNVNFAFKNQLSGTWTGASVASFAENPEHISFAFNNNDVPGMSILHGGELEYATFDVQSGEWVLENIASGIGDGRVDLVFDNNGAPAMAYADNGNIVYTINTGEGWVDYVLPSGIDSASGYDVTPLGDTDVSLAFDADNLPVISYAANCGIVLAYDPPYSVPEPTTAAMILLGMAGIFRRR